MIKNLIRRDEWKVVALRALAEPFFLRDFFFPAVAGDHAVKPVRERGTQIAGNFTGFDFIHNQTLIAAPKRQKSRCMAADFIPSNRALPFF